MSMGITGHRLIQNLPQYIKSWSSHKKIYKKEGFLVVNVTNEPIETIADEIAGLIAGRAKEH